MDHAVFNETFREIARWNLHSDTACFSEEIQEAAPKKTAVI